MPLFLILLHQTFGGNNFIKILIFIVILTQSPMQLGIQDFLIT